MEFFDIFIFNNVKSNLKNHILPAKKSGFQDKSVIFVTSIPIPEAPMGRGWADIHMVKGVFVRFDFDAVRIWQFEQKLSRTKQRERLMRCIVYSPHWLWTILSLIVKSAFYIRTQAWGFRRCIGVVH